MLRDTDIIGVAEIGSLTAFEFSEEDKLLFRTVVSRATAAVVKARILADLRRAETTQRFLSEASRQLAESLDCETTLTGIAHLAVPTIADWCIVGLSEERQLRVVSVAHTDPARERLARELQLRDPTSLDAPSGLANVLRTGVPEWSAEISDAALTAAARDSEHLRILRELGFKSYIVVPIASRRQVLGAIALITAESHRRYSESDVRVAEDLASRAGTAIDNARLYSEAQAASASRQQVLAIVSHDLRNQLGVIAAGGELLARRAGEAAQDDLSKPIETIRRTTRSMQRLVGALADVASIQAGQLSVDRQPIDLVSVLDEARDGHEALARAKQLGLKWECESRGVRVLADRSRILQVLANLLGNAIKFSEPGDSIVLRAEKHASEVVIGVSDTGPGIPAEDLRKLFQPSYTIERSRQSGTGLGLYIAKGIVQRHAGRLWVESAVGVGTTFFFTLPVA